MKNNVTVDCDVLVVGTGISGWAAAITASREGARTVLLDRNDFPGGTVISGMHRYLCGLYADTGSRTLNPGLARELVTGLKMISPENKKVRMGKVQVLSFRSNDLERYLRVSLGREKNLTVFLNTRAYAVQARKNTIHAVKATNDKKTFEFRPKIVIDGSGDGSIIRLSKAPQQPLLLKERQLSGFSVRVRGVKDTDRLLPIKIPYHIPLATYTRMENAGEGVIRLNIPAGKNIVTVKKEAARIFDCLRKTLPEFKQARIVGFSPAVQDREGIRLRGKYTLTASDILRGREFADGEVKNAWPIELWSRKKGPQYQYLTPGRYYEIPVRCLISQKIKNLLACGRCISVTHEALGSTRVAGTCLSLGEAAGKIAVRSCAYS